jgi:hypothetical protein
MNDAPRTIPHYINEDKSDMRGIKSGWYAIDEDGNLVFGPFDTYDQCVERNIQPTYLMLPDRFQTLPLRVGDSSIGLEHQVEWQHVPDGLHRSTRRLQSTIGTLRRDRMWR